MASPVEEIIKAPRTFDMRFTVGIGITALMLGVIVGFKLAAGAEPFVVREEIKVPAPCADCAEREVQAARAASSGNKGTPGTEVSGGDAAAA